MMMIANGTQEPPGGEETNNMWVPKDASLLTILVLDTLITLLCGCVVTACVMWRINKRSEHKEERDKLTAIIRNHYWEFEESITKLVRTLLKLRQSLLFRDVTELHVFGYKYRTECSVYGTREYLDMVNDKNKSMNAIPGNFAVAKKIERLFETLALQLPCKGYCPENILTTFGPTLYHLAQDTVLLWSDKKGRVIQNLVFYFAGRIASDRFTGSLISDEDLETLVVARLPYANQLYFSNDHFVLQDVQISEIHKIDLKSKIRYIDTVLANNCSLLEKKEKNITEAYYTSREICLKSNFIQNQNHLPDIVTKVGEPSRIGECVMYLRHLLRLMCTPRNIKKVESDDKFFQFLMQLHEALYTWSDPTIMLEVIERIRNNIFSYLKGFTSEQMLIDKEFTKAKLEYLEKELYKHLHYLTLKQVHKEKDKQQYPSELGEQLKTGNSESSIYTMALSTSSYLMHRQGMQEQDKLDRLKHPELHLLHQQSSITSDQVDQSSIVSGSSMYATAMSISSGGSAAPLMQRSPPLNRIESESPDNMDKLIQIDSGEFYETAV